MRFVTLMFYTNCLNTINKKQNKFSPTANMFFIYIIMTTQKMIYIILKIMMVNVIICGFDEDVPPSAHESNIYYS